MPVAVVMFVKRMNRKSFEANIDNIIDFFAYQLGKKILYQNI